MTNKLFRRSSLLATTVALGLMGAAGTASAADLTATLALTSDYDFRGVTQSAKDPAAAFSLDFATDSGVYFGAWTSNIDFGPDLNEDREIDLYAGINHEYANGVGVTAGAVLYTYFGDNSLDYLEYNVGASYKNFSTKLWYTNDNVNVDQDAFYLEFNYTHDLPYDLTLGLHAGFSRGEYFKNLTSVCPDVGGGSEVTGAPRALGACDPNAVNGEYEDFSVGVSREFGPFTAGLKYIYVNVDDSFKVTDDVFNNESRLFLSLATTFPWKD